MKNINFRQVPMCLLWLMHFLPIWVNPAWLHANPFRVQGMVIDQQTGQPIPHVNIRIVNTRHGTVSQTDGSFTLTYSRPIHLLRVSHVGYVSIDYQIDPAREIHLIALRKHPVELKEVQVRPELNPALRIIDNTIAAREKNNPRNLPSFSYTAYTRFVLSGNPPPPPSGESDTTAADSARIRMQQFFDTRHLMISESVSDIKFVFPSRLNETVVANRISGFQNPEFSIIASMFQSFSAYENYFTIAGQSFVSPISPEGRRKSSYELLQVEKAGNDTLFTIGFAPAFGRVFDALEGIIQISSNNWAVKSIQARPARQGELFRFSVTQNYMLVDGKYWFPEELHFRFEMELILEGDPLPINGEGKTFLQNILINPPLAARDIGSYQLEFSPDMAKNTELLQRFRPDTLDERELKTYAFIDSIGRVNNWDQVFGRTEALMRGKMQSGVLDFGILHFLRFNDVRGAIPGMQISTNRSFSRHFTLQGNISYGIRNRSLTYGLGGSVHLWHRQSLKAGYHFQRDFVEPGFSLFLTPTTLLSPEVLRSYFVLSQDLLISHTAWIQTRALRNRLWLQAYISRETAGSEIGYLFKPYPFHQGYGDFRFTESGVRARIGIGEQFIRTPSRILAIEGNRPVLHLNLARGTTMLPSATATYWRAEARLTSHLNIPRLGRQQWLVQFGYVSSGVPWQKLFTAPASFRRFSIAAPSSFSTMRPSEFASNRYIMAFFVHNFENRLWRARRHSPDLHLLANFAIGNLSNPDLHHFAPFRQMNKGFFEAGFALENLLNIELIGLGLEFLYRLGAYSFPDMAENYSIRLRFTLMPGR